MGAAVAIGGVSEMEGVREGGWGGRGTEGTDGRTEADEGEEGEKKTAGAEGGCEDGGGGSCVGVWREGRKGGVPGLGPTGEEGARGSGSLRVSRPRDNTCMNADLAEEHGSRVSSHVNWGVWQQ